MDSENNRALINDAELLARASSGNDRSALPELMKRHQWIRGVLYNILHNSEDVNDAFQDTWSKVIECLSDQSYLQIRNFRTWLFSTARNAALMMMRSRKYIRHDEAAVRSAENRGEDVVNLRLDEGDVNAILDELPPQMSRVVRKRVIEDRTVKETADDLHITEGAVMSSCWRGLKKLRRNKRF